MARIIKNLNTEYQSYLSNNVRENKSLNSADLSIAGYLVYLEEIRKDAASNGNNNNDFIFVSYDKIKENTNIQSRDTISRSLTKLKAFDIILKSQQGRYTEGKCNQYWINPLSLKSSECTNSARAIPSQTSSSAPSMEEMMKQILDMKARLETTEAKYKETRRHNEELLRIIEDMRKQSVSTSIPNTAESPDSKDDETAYIEVLNKKVPILTKKEDRFYHSKLELKKSFKYEGMELTDLEIDELREEIIYRVQHRVDEYYAVWAYQSAMDEYRQGI